MFKMFIIFALFAVVVPSFQALHSHGATSEYNNTITKEQDYLAYVNSTYGIKIEYPSDWSLRENVDLIPTDPFVEIVKFYSPVTQKDKYGWTILVYEDIRSINRSSIATLNELLERTIIEKQVLPDFKIVEAIAENETAGKSYAWYRLTWIDNILGFDRKLTDVGTIVNNRIFVIKYSATSENYSVGSDIFAKMVDSFQLMN